MNARSLLLAGAVGPGVLTIRRKEDGSSAMLDTNQIPEKDDPKTIGLVFDKARDIAYLTAVWGVTASSREVKRLVEGREN